MIKPAFCKLLELILCVFRCDKVSTKTEASGDGRYKENQEIHYTANSQTFYYFIKPIIDELET